MKRLALIVLIITAPAFAAPSASHAADNDAVKVDASGNRTVELPPAPVGVNGKPQPPRTMPFLIKDPGAVYMIETAESLLECTQIDFKPGECRASTIGQKALSRTWVVKRQGKWWLCAGINADAECADPPAYNGGKGSTSWRLPAMKM